MGEKDLISVIIPSFNREHTILRALESVINQTYSNIEIIVVDDCSKDKTVPLVKELMKKESRLQLLINIENKGPNYTRNRGIEQAQGKYISFLDSDDEWYPETLKILWKKLKNTNKNIGVVYAGMEFITPRYKRKIYPKYKGNVFRKLMTMGTIGTYPLIKREIFTKTGIFDESEVLRIGGAQDYEMWIRISQYYKFEYVNKILLKHYFESDSITFRTAIKKPITKIKTYFYIWNKYKEKVSKDSDVYIFFCYKIFELFNASQNKEWAKKIIFMAFKSKKLKLRSYYHLIFYLHNFYSPIDILSKVQELARQLKEYYERFKFHFSQ